MKILLFGKTKLSEVAAKIEEVLLKNKFDVAFCLDLSIDDDTSPKIDTYYLGSGPSIHNLHPMGSCGITEICSLSVAFITGYYGEFSQVSLSASGVDLFLTTEFPFGVDKFSSKPNSSGLAAISDVSKALTPRYHFSISNIFYEREPYKNEQSYVTRFIGLSEMGSKERVRLVSLT